MLLTIISGILFFIALLCLGIVLIINSRSFYHLLAEPLDIVSESGLAKEVIIRNYDHLIDYCSPFYHGGLSFPDFPSSDSALSHFAETKVLFSCFYLAVPVCCLLGALLTIVKIRIKQRQILSDAFKYKTCASPHTGLSIWKKMRFKTSCFVCPATEFSCSLRLAAWLCFLFPLACLLLFFTDFHKVFYAMHHIFFQNNDWIFDAATDPVITILPERYFLCCGIGIAVFLLLAAAWLIFACKYLKATDMRVAARPQIPMRKLWPKYGHSAVKRRPAAADSQNHQQQPEQ